MKNVLLAGATGYLGGYIAHELADRDYNTTAIVRNPDALIRKGIPVDRVIHAEVTRDEQLKGCCDGIDVVISTIGITKQKDGLTYFDVDYQANMNLLTEAVASSVRKFIYVSVLNGEKLRHLKICAAKEQFVDALKSSGLEYCVIRPNGFFSDMREFYNMAQRGRVYLFGDGGFKANPIHGEDLATICVNAITATGLEIAAGGPEVLSHNQIAEIAFEATGKQPKLTYIPAWVSAAILRIFKLLTGAKVYGPIEFFMTVMSMDMIAPACGRHTLRAFYTELNEMDN